MADNKTTTATVSTVPIGTIVATDEIGGVDYQRVKLACGPDGTATDVPVGGGVEAAALRVTLANDSTGLVSVDDNGGSLTVDAVGNVAHDAADSGAPVKIGGKAFAGANLTAVADGDRADLRVDSLGRVVTTPYQTRGHVVHQATTITNSTTETTILTAAASTYHDIVSLIITNATATAVTVTIKDDTAGTTRGIFAIAANGGGVFNFPLPWTQGATNDHWTATLSALSITVHIVAVAVKNV